MDDDMAWLVLFAGLVSIRFHPRNADCENNTSLEVSWIADVADDAFVQFRKRFPKVVSDGAG